MSVYIYTARKNETVKVDLGSRTVTAHKMTFRRANALDSARYDRAGNEGGTETAGGWIASAAERAWGDQSPDYVLMEHGVLYDTRAVRFVVWWDTDKLPGEPMARVEKIKGRYKAIPGLLAAERVIHAAQGALLEAHLRGDGDAVQALLWAVQASKEQDPRRRVGHLQRTLQFTAAALGEDHECFGGRVLENLLEWLDSTWSATPECDLQFQCVEALGWKFAAKPLGEAEATYRLGTFCS